MYLRCVKDQVTCKISLDLTLHYASTFNKELDISHFIYLRIEEELKLQLKVIMNKIIK